MAEWSLTIYASKTECNRDHPKRRPDKRKVACDISPGVTTLGSRSCRASKSSRLRRQLLQVVDVVVKAVTVLLSDESTRVHILCRAYVYVEHV